MDEALREVAKGRRWEFRGIRLILSEDFRARLEAAKMTLTPNGSWLFMEGRIVMPDQVDRRFKSCYLRSSGPEAGLVTWQNQGKRQSLALFATTLTASATTNTARP